MNRLSAAALCLLLAAGCSEPTADSKSGEPAGADITFVSGVRLIPGDAGVPIENAAMVIENGVIKEIGEKGKLPAPKGAARIELDGQGKTIMPLLVNLYAYPGLNNAGNFGAKNYNRELLTADISRYGYYGVGAVLAFGTDTDDLALKTRDELKAKGVIARLYTSGRGITGKGGWPGADLNGMPMFVNGAEDARKAVTELAGKKVDAITIWANDSLKADAISAAVDEAHKNNLKVFADAPSLAHAKEAVKAGVDGLVGSVRQQEVDAELVSLLKEKNAIYAPALTAIEAGFVYADDPKWLGEQTMREVYPAKLAGYLADTVTVNKFKRRPESASARQQYSIATKNLKKIAEGGVKIALGSASGSADTFPGYFEHRELELMVAAGVSPAEALRAATSVSAEALGAKDLGALAVGKRGDFMILSSNPLDKITDSRSIDRVYVGGHELDRLATIRDIKIEAPKITAADRAADADLERIAREEREDAGLKKFGKFALGPIADLGGGVVVSTPKRSRHVDTKGPPHKVVVTLQGARADDLRGFYAESLPANRWTAAGSCWEKKNAVSGKTMKLCADASAGQIVLNITEQ